MPNVVVALAAVMVSEACVLGEEGMLAIGHVIMNRVARIDFPNDVISVIEQPGQWATPGDPMGYHEALARRVLRRDHDPTDGALFALSEQDREVLGFPDGDKVIELNEVTKLHLYKVWPSSFLQIVKRRADSRIPCVFDEFDYRYVEEEESIAPGFARAVSDVLKPKSVVDLGCGLGIYLREFKKLGVEVRGYDNSPYAVENSMVGPDVVRLHDLQDPLEIDRRYDLCMCVEVGEHVAKEFSRQLVKTATGFSAVVYWTAALPGQGGRYHFNLQPPEFWQELFEEFGYSWDVGLTVQMRDRFVEEVPILGVGHRIWSSCRIYTNERTWDKMVERSLVEHADVWRRLADA